MPRSTILGWVLLGSLPACSAPAEDRPSPPKPPDREAVAVVAEAPSPTPEAPPAAATPPAAKVEPGPPRGRGDYCKADADCGWDDPCAARRCVGGERPESPGCEESEPLPGTCSCVENQCTLRPDAPASGASTAGCTSDDECAVDVGAGTCQLGGETLIGPIDRQGPICTCNPATTKCEWSWVGPIACETWKDCSWIRTPRLRPASSKAVPRPFARQVRACKDGELDSVCKDAVCELVAWSC